MTLSDHLRVVGTLLVLLGLSHFCFNRFFGWERELKSVSLFTRRVFYVHTFFIGLGVTLCGLGSIVYADTLVRPSALSRALLGGLVIFWLCRLLAQFFAYDAVIWRGNRFRTIMHGAFSVLWVYVTATYGTALFTVWNRS